MIIASLTSIMPLLTLAILFIMIGTYLLFSSKSPTNWPTVEGKIVKSELKFESKGGENTEIMKCEPAIGFEYTVNSQNIVGSKISFSKKPIDRVEAQDIIDAYGVGEKVEVFYNPNDPEMAVLETSSNNVAYYFIGAGLLVGIIPLIKMLLTFS
jgi:hypothetical protein